MGSFDALTLGWRKTKHTHTRTQAKHTLAHTYTSQQKHSTAQHAQVIAMQRHRS